jgi:peroxiredoxin Q/BCP
MSIRKTTLAVGTALLAVGFLAARLPAADLEVGSPAPSFQSQDDSGKTWKSDDHIGKKITVVYFYPAALTGGCTRQACGFRDDMKKLTEMGVEVVGVSGDEVPNLQLFKQAHDLNFTLLADTDGSVAKKFGVPLRPGGQITSEVDGQTHILKRGVTAARWTFLIDEDGRVALKNTQVNAADDSKQILQLVHKLQGEQP